MPIVEMLQFVGDDLGDLARDELEDYGKGTGLLEHFGVLDQLFRLFGRLPWTR